MTSRSRAGAQHKLAFYIFHSPYQFLITGLGERDLTAALTFRGPPECKIAHSGRQSEQQRDLECRRVPLSLC